MRVKSCRIDVENFSLSRQNCEDSLNAMKLLAVAKVDVLNEMIQNFDQVGEELNVDDVSESVNEKGRVKENLFLLFSTYFANPSSVELRSFEFGFCLRILK